MLKNIAKFDLNELKVVFGEKNIINFPDEYESVGVSLDTRLVGKDNIFVALKGEKIDGHTKISDAFANGATCCILEKSFYEIIDISLKNKPYILVNDTLEALGSLAKFFRLKFNIPIIAICGSNGKTTTKEMLASLLSEKYNVLKTYQNFNNRIGVPLMLFQLNESYEIAVLELGTNTPGEISILSEMTMPEFALIINIGKEHLEELIDIDGVELEETSILAKIRGRGSAFINNDDERLKKYIMILDKYIRFGTETDAEVTAKISLNGNQNPTIEFTHSQGSFTANMNTFGYASALNALAATTVALYFDIDSSKIISALESFRPLIGNGYARMSVENRSGKIIINDCYNANPSSMTVALSSLKMMDSNGSKIAILGDMRELGESSEIEHIAILNEATESADKVIITGDEFQKAHLNSTFPQEKVLFFAEKGDIISYLNENLKIGDTVLVKGSRGMKMEEIINAL